MGDEPVVVRGKLDVDDERAQIILDDLRPTRRRLTEGRARSAHPRAA